MPDPEAILPQQGTYALAVITSVNWLFEPYWPGDRLIARLTDGRVTVTDATGARAAPEYDEVGPLLAAAIDAEQAVVDGIWTNQPFVGNGDGGRRIGEKLVAEGVVETAPDPADLETRRAFVAIDLLELDGTPLFDVPFQERRRLLISLVAEDVRVRLSPAVKLPIKVWLSAWRTNGFEHYVAKHVNSRYRPGEQADDWLVMPTEPEKPPSMVGRFFGQRPRKLRRIED
jgi:bifunctional non-homologous end joining protein LigD